MPKFYQAKKQNPRGKNLANLFAKQTLLGLNLLLVSLDGSHPVDAKIAAGIMILLTVGALMTCRQVIMNGSNQIYRPLAL